MPVKIRLARRGRRKNAFYHIIVADSRAPRDGRFIEKLGTYNPMTKPATIEIDSDRAYSWLMQGAQPTDTARAILRFKGVMYKKHLARGVEKGAMTQDQADSLFKDWLEKKESKTAARVEQSKLEREEFLRKLSGSTKQEAPDVTPATEELSDFQVGTEADDNASGAQEEE